MLDPAVNIDYFEKELAIGLAGGLNVASYNPRVIDEQTTGAFVEANGELEILGNLRYNVGVRRIDTDQFLSGYRVTGRRAERISSKSYDKLLPSFNIASDLGHGLVLRAAASKTMTRPQPGDMAPNGSLSINGDVYTIGNPELDPLLCEELRPGPRMVFRRIRPRRHRIECLAQGDRGLYDRSSARRRRSASWASTTRRCRSPRRRASRTPRTRSAAARRAM